MPRQLGDVLHYFLPELAPAPAAPEVAYAHRTLTVPVGELDVLRAALVWNLAVELARQGGRVALVAPRAETSESLWPGTGRGPLGLELHPAEGNLPGVAKAAREVAAAAPGTEESFAVVALPPAWLRRLGDDSEWLDWLLVLARPEDRELLEAYAAMKRVAHAQPAARLGFTVYGARSIAEAERTFSRVATTVDENLGRRLLSYGLLVDDLHLCRSIVTRRPVALTHPRSPAARALADVARLVRGDAAETGDV